MTAGAARLRNAIGARLGGRRKPLGLQALRRAAACAAAMTASVAAPVAIFVLLLTSLRHGLLFDFKGDLWTAGRSILHGGNPYQPGFIDAQAAVKHAGGRAVTWFALPVYPAPALVWFVPFALLPLAAGGVILIVLSAAALVVSLRLLGVRDWRCHALVLTSWPALYGMWLGTLSPLLVLGVAVVWRYRQRLIAPAAAAAVVVVAKLFLWPLLVWMVITRRWRMTLVSLLLILVTVAVGWWAIGFAGFGAYPHVLSTLTYVTEDAGPSLVATLIGQGVAPAPARVLALALALGLALAAWRLARQNHPERAFGLTVMAALTASPLVWAHYLVLVFVPIALLSPSLSPLWFAPLLTYLEPTPDPHQLLRLAPWIVMEVIVVVQLCGGTAPRLGLPRSARRRAYSQ